MKNYYVFVQNDHVMANELESVMIGDLLKQEYSMHIVRENAARGTNAFCARRKVQKIAGFILNFWIKRTYKLWKILVEKAPLFDRVIVVFFNTAFTSARYPQKVLKAYKKKWPHVKYVLYYTDSLVRGVSNYANYLRKENVFDLVYSFDEADAEKEHLFFWPTPYSEMEEFVNIKPNKDLYFVGVGTDRFEILNDISQKAIVNKCRASIEVLNTSGNILMLSQSNEVLSITNEIRQYREVLKKTLEAQCILEVVRPNQSGLTLRAYEAVAYNRKLLTNNPSIFSFPFYDPRYMHYFEKAEDIDWEWVKKECKVNYGYKDEFSPVHLLEDVKSRLEKDRD